MLAYCGSLHLGLYAELGVVPDLVDLVHDLTSSFGALRLALESPAPGPRPRTRTAEGARRPGAGG